VMGKSQMKFHGQLSNLSAIRFQSFNKISNPNILTVQKTNTRLGDRSFSVADPKIWNSLPASLWQPDIEFGHFERLLKAFLFGKTVAH